MTSLSWPCAIVIRSDLHASPAESQQQIRDLIERLNGGCRIVDGRRERFDGDVDQQSERILRVLIEGPFLPQLEGSPQHIFIDEDA